VTRRTITRDWVAVLLLTAVWTAIVSYLAVKRYLARGTLPAPGRRFETETVRVLARPDGSQWVELATIEMTP
jgi:hypothetical protein